jgi:hypothetical protein
LSTTVIKGVYKTRRDGGVLYTYHASWNFSHTEVRWSGMVWRSGQLAGTPSGRLDLSDREAAALVIRELMESSIEQLQ